MRIIFYQKTPYYESEKKHMLLALYEIMNRFHEKVLCKFLAISKELNEWSLNAYHLLA